MPPSNLRIIHPGTVIIPLQSTTITELLILFLFTVVQVFILQFTDSFRTNPCHGQSKGIIIRFPGNGASPVLYMLVIKEHPSLLCRSGQASLISISLLKQVTDRSHMQNASVLKEHSRQLRTSYLKIISQRLNQLQIFVYRSSRLVVSKFYSVAFSRP